MTDCCQINVGRSSLSSVEALTVCSSVELNMTFGKYQTKKEFQNQGYINFLQRGGEAKVNVVVN